LTKPDRGGVAGNTAEALANLAHDPGQNVVEPIYALTQLSDLCDPPLTSMPDAWTVTVKVNDSGDDAVLFGGPGNLAFDSRGYAWLTNNVVQGTPNSSYFVMALKPNGEPADGTNATPTSPFMGHPGDWFWRYHRSVLLGVGSATLVGARAVTAIQLRILPGMEAFPNLTYRARRSRGLRATTTAH